jgi:hypothetical protein
VNLNEFLLSKIPSKEIKIRMGNNLIKINGEPIKERHQELPVEDEAEELGEFVFRNIEALAPFTGLITIKDMFGPEPTNIPALQFLTEHLLLSISKREHFVFKYQN